MSVPASIDASGGTTSGRPCSRSSTASPTARSFVPERRRLRVEPASGSTTGTTSILDGRGTTIRTTGSGGSALSSPFVLSWASSNTDIWIRNFVLEGNNTRTGPAIYDGAQESQAGIDLNGGAGSSSAG